MQLSLSDPSLLKNQAYVDGIWIDADDGTRFAVTNPVNGEVITEVAKAGQSETARAIAAASEAMRAWARKPAKARAVILRKWFDLIMANAEDLAALMTAEQGKPLAEAIGEISYGAGFIEFYAEECKRMMGDTIPTIAADRRLQTYKQPVGVVACITPWNFPCAMITRKAAPALAAGCSVVIKPDPQTPLSALALCELAARAGIPAHVATSRAFLLALASKVSQSSITLGIFPSRSPGKTSSIPRSLMIALISAIFPEFEVAKRIFMNFFLITKNFALISKRNLGWRRS